MFLIPKRHEVENAAFAASSMLIAKMTYLIRL